MKSRSRRGATPLLWVLGTLAILIILTVKVSHTLEVEETLAESTRLDRLADQGFQNVIQWASWFLEFDARLEKEAKLKDSEKEDADTLNDVWNVGPETPFIDEDFPELLIRWRLVDGNSRLNLNRLVNGSGLVSEDNRERLKLMMIELQLSEIDGLVASLSDWLDRDPNQPLEDSESPAEPVLGDENAFEEDARNAPLTLLAELGMVPGYTQEVLWGDPDDKTKLGLAPWVTIHSSGKVNANTATPWVLMGASKEISRGMARRIVAGQPHESLEDVLKAAGVDADDPSASLITGALTIASNFFILEMEADYLGRKHKRRAFLVRQNGRVDVLSIESHGFFRWDEELREDMAQAEKDIFDDIKDKNSSFN